MDNLWLLVAAGALFLLAFALLIGLAIKRRRRRSETSRSAVAATEREDELRALGISDIRPRSSAAAPSSPEPADEEESDAFEVSGGAAVTPEDGPLPERNPAPVEPEPVAEAPAPVQARPAPQLSTREESPLWEKHSPTAVASFLRALWAATEVQTVTLFATDAGADHYTLEAALSHSPVVRREGRFPANDLFFESLSPDRPLTVLEDGDPLIERLPYYKRPVHVGAVAVLPVRAPEGRRVVLVVDLPPDQPVLTDRQRTLLLGFTDLLGQLLSLPPDDAAVQPVPTRRAITAEEMSRARADGRPLALALIWRTDAEAVEQEGEAAVAERERELRLFLEDLARGSRVERFGELMYGVFLHEEPHQLERWAGRVRSRALDVELPLVIGIARLAEHHTDADALRADAVNALQEALAAQRAFAVVE